MHRPLVKEAAGSGRTEEGHAREQVRVIYSALINHVKFPRVSPPPY